MWPMLAKPPQILPVQTRQMELVAKQRVRTAYDESEGPWKKATDFSEEVRQRRTGAL